VAPNKQIEVKPASLMPIVHGIRFSRTTVFE
jgi:hypothetical protein